MRLQHTYWWYSPRTGEWPSAGSGGGPPVGGIGPGPAPSGPASSGPAPATGTGGPPPSRASVRGGGGVSLTLLVVRSMTPACAYSGTAAGETSMKVIKDDSAAGPGWPWAVGSGWLCQLGLPLSRERQIILNVGCSIN